LKARHPLLAQRLLSGPCSGQSGCYFQYGVVAELPASTNTTTFMGMNKYSFFETATVAM
jgi:hypothetical protein